jgi:hypothetical protein
MTRHIDVKQSAIFRSRVQVRLGNGAQKPAGETTASPNFHEEAFQLRQQCHCDMTGCCYVPHTIRPDFVQL